MCKASVITVFLCYHLLLLGFLVGKFKLHQAASRENDFCWCIVRTITNTSCRPDLNNIYLTGIPSPLSVSSNLSRLLQNCWSWVPVSMKMAEKIVLTLTTPLIGFSWTPSHFLPNVCKALSNFFCFSLYSLYHYGQIMAFGWRISESLRVNIE